MKMKLNSIVTISYILLLIGAICSSVSIWIGYSFIDDTQEPGLSYEYMIKGTVGLLVCIILAVIQKCFNLVK